MNITVTFGEIAPDRHKAEAQRLLEGIVVPDDTYLYVFAHWSGTDFTEVETSPAAQPVPAGKVLIGSVCGAGTFRAAPD